MAAAGKRHSAGGVGVSPRRNLTQTEVLAAYTDVEPGTDRREIHAALNRGRIPLTRCTVERLMRSEGLQGDPSENGRSTRSVRARRPSVPRIW